MPFVTFEGIDGSGKSSLLASFVEHLNKQGLSVETTREPGGSELGQELRQALLKHRTPPPCPRTELLLYAADRAQHVETKIKPWLKMSKWVVSDRFADSSIAFQGAGRHIDLKDVEWLNKFATGGLKPDLTVIVDCPIEVSLLRRKVRENEKQQAPDRFEAEKQAFHEAVRNQYLALARTEKRFFVMDGTLSPPQLLKNLINECEKRGLL